MAALRAEFLAQLRAWVGGAWRALGHDAVAGPPLAAGEMDALGLVAVKPGGDESAAASLLADLASGELLCLLVNAVEPGAVPTVYSSPSVYGKLANLSQLASACPKLDIVALYNPRQVAQGRHLVPFLATALALADAVHARDPRMPAAPPKLSVKELTALGIVPRTDDPATPSPPPATTDTRLALLEEQHLRLATAVHRIESSSLASRAAVDQLSAGLLDAFADIQTLVAQQRSVLQLLSTPAISADPGNERRPSLPRHQLNGSGSGPVPIAQAAELSAASRDSLASTSSANFAYPTFSLPRGSGTIKLSTVAQNPTVNPAIAALRSTRSSCTLPIDPPVSPAAAVGSGDSATVRRCRQPLTMLPPSSHMRAGTSFSIGSTLTLDPGADAAPITSLDTLVDGGMPLAASPEAATVKTRPTSVLEESASEDGSDSDEVEAESLATADDDVESVVTIDAEGDEQEERPESVVPPQPMLVSAPLLEAPAPAAAEPTPPTTPATPATAPEKRVPTLREQFHQRLPAAVIDACPTRIELMRQSAIYELIVTERDFVHDLTVTLNVVRPFVRDRLPRPDGALGGDDPDAFFGNLPQVLANHVKIVEAIDAELARSPVVEWPGRLIEGMIPLLSCHVEYATHYSTHVSMAMQLPAFRQLNAAVTEIPETKRQSLDSLMIKPIQRIAKYPLLLLEVKKHSFENSPEYPVLERSCTELQSLLEIVDSSSVAYSHRDKLATFSKSVAGFQDLDLSAQSQFIREGPMFRWAPGGSVSGASTPGPGKLTQTHWILFSDLLLVCKPASARSLRKKYDIFHALAPNRLVVHATGTNTIYGHPDLFTLEVLPVGEEGGGGGAAGGGGGGDWAPLTFATESVDERNAWLRALQKATVVYLQRGVSSLVRRKSKRLDAISIKRPWSFLMDNIKNTASITANTQLPKSPINPRDLPDNVELLALTLDSHTPTSTQELGFHRHTFLRVVNCDGDHWKVSMNRVTGLVPRALVAKFDAPPARYARIMQACQSDAALTWLEYSADCVVNLRPTAMVAAIAAAAAQQQEQEQGSEDAVVGSRGAAAPRPRPVSMAAAPTQSRVQALAAPDPARPKSMVITSSLPSSTAAAIAPHHKARLSRRNTSGSSLGSTTTTAASTSPQKPARPGEPVPVPHMKGWFWVAPASGGDGYYFNETTKESRWKLPPPPPPPAENESKGSSEIAVV
ncbi:hypothetical protein H9P43_007659 [Blastocladiella emersonii ATCC 22665]|nr:hypothetical protein H9P43_007659 [Blastocladiella emersonii ATCC 22665]